MTKPSKARTARGAEGGAHVWVVEENSAGYWWPCETYINERLADTRMGVLTAVNENIKFRIRKYVRHP